MLALKIVLGGAMILAGILHFAMPKPFVEIMPRVLPFHRALVYLSGACEIVLGAGLLFPATQVLAAWGLVALFIAVFPANVSQALRGVPFGGAPLWVTWARLPLQAVFIAWAYAFT